jgi:uncharacterized protein YsxB (DUF464 family)
MRSTRKSRIRVRLTGAGGAITGFIAENHGDPVVCAALSILAINTVNSIESFTDAAFSVDYDEKGGYLSFSLKETDAGAELLLRAFGLGLSSLSEQYGDEITIMWEELE